MPPARRERFLRGLTDRERAALDFTWGFWSRPEQQAPDWAWAVCLWLAGRGWGKTRTGAEWVREQVERKGKKRLILVAPTAADARDVMIEGESGLLAISPPWFRPHYEPSKRRLTWPNGALASIYSADEPERLRGPQSEAAWCDELGSWRYPEAWDNLLLGLRLGQHPQVVVTTTPKPTKLIRELVKDPLTALIKGSTYDNQENLAPTFIRRILQLYEGTRLGRQELYAEILDDVPGALWSRALIESTRVKRAHPDLVKLVVAVDPAVTNDPESSDEVGIVVVGLGSDGHAYVLEDFSGIYSPSEWARKVCTAYHTLNADRVVAETNQGGALVEVNLRTVDPHIAYTGVHASRGKHTRAEPVAALYEQGRVHHVGFLAGLEDQLCTWDPKNDKGSPDRLDALVWAITYLMLDKPPAPSVRGT